VLGSGVHRSRLDVGRPQSRIEGDLVGSRSRILETYRAHTRAGSADLGWRQRISDGTVNILRVAAPSAPGPKE